MDLVKVSRSLDRDDALDRVRKALSRSPAGQYVEGGQYAVILNWLLKSMNGPSLQAEAFRRSQHTWDILETLFRRIPVGFLAQSLHDRNFIPALQQTVDDVSTPRDSPSDEEMSDGSSSSRKRKRRELEDDLASLRIASGCLNTAEFLFPTLEVLFARLDSEPSESSGTEHLKSLFRTPASQAMKLLAPLLRICNLELVSRPPNHAGRRGQESWIRVIITLWGLHANGPSDPFEIATHLAPVGCVMLGKMMNPAQRNVALPPRIVTAWSRDISHLLKRKMLMPARSAYLQSKDDQILRLALNDTPGIASLISATLFQLATYVQDNGRTLKAKKDTEEWLQHVFDTVRVPLAGETPLARTDALISMLDAAAKRGVSPTSATLLAICRDHAILEPTTNWRLLASIAGCEPEAFLDDHGGLDLLNSILDQVARAPNSKYSQDEERASRVSFVVSIAKGFVSAKNFTGFIKLWLEQLSKVSVIFGQDKLANAVWCNPALHAFIAESLQPSLSAGQFSAILEWIETQDAPAVQEARLIVLDAIASGIQSDEFENIAGARLMDMALQAGAESLHSLQWRILSKALPWVEYPEVKSLWGKTSERLAAVLHDGKLKRAATLEAFRCSSNFLYLFRYSNDLLDDVRGIINKFLVRLKRELPENASEISRQAAGQNQEENGTGWSSEKMLAKLPVAAYITWFLHHGVNLLSETSTSQPSFMNDLLRRFVDEDGSDDESEDAVHRLYSLLSENGVEMIQGLMTEALVRAVEAENASKPWSSSRQRTAIRLLLRMPERRFVYQSQAPTADGGNQAVNKNQMPSRIAFAVLRLTEAREEKGGPATPDWSEVLSIIYRIFNLFGAPESFGSDELTKLGDLLDKSKFEATPSRAAECTELFRAIADIGHHNIATDLKCEPVVPGTGLQERLQERKNQEALKDDLDAQLSGSSQAAKQKYLASLVVDDQLRSLLSINYIVHELGSGNSQSTGHTDGLSSVFGHLLKSLGNAKSPKAGAIITQTLSNILVMSPRAIRQRNIDQLLVRIQEICASSQTTDSVRSALNTFNNLYRLLGNVLQRHRQRIEGRFHLLVAALQALLQCIIMRPKTRKPIVDLDTKSWTEDRPMTDVNIRWSQAKRFSRLLEMVCEPSVSTVAPRQSDNFSSSAIDAAKRSAGESMYLVLVEYIRLQLHSDVPAMVREALEPGVFSVISITPMGTRSVMNASMDPSGRAVWKEMYRDWTDRGLWKGV